MQQKVRFQIEGMTCQACASRIEKVLNKKDFVESAGVNFASEEAQVTFDDSKTSAADIAKIIEKTGYGAKEKTEDTLPQPEAENHIGFVQYAQLGGIFKHATSLRAGKGDRKRRRFVYQPRDIFAHLHGVKRRVSDLYIADLLVNFARFIKFNLGAHAF